MVRKKMSFAFNKVRVEMDKLGVDLVARNGVDLLRVKMDEYTKKCTNEALKVAKKQNHVILTSGDFQTVINNGCMTTVPTMTSLMIDAVSKEPLRRVMKQAGAGKVSSDGLIFFKDQLNLKIANTIDIAMDLTRHANRKKVTSQDIGMALSLPLR